VGPIKTCLLCRWQKKKNWSVFYSIQFSEIFRNFSEHFFLFLLLSYLKFSLICCVFSESDDWGELSVYPRFCLFYWHDHTKAAFYPPVTSTDPMSTTRHTLSSASKASHAERLSEDLLIQFVQSFLQDPAGSLIETERF